MSRKWLAQETPVWVEKGIVTEVQAEQLLALYDEKKRAVGLLPLLGSLLVGIGILTFVAANWQQIGAIWRMAILLLAVAGFYAAGEALSRRSDRRLGLAMTGIGLMAFGGAIFLIVQTYHMVTFHTYSFVLWGAAGVLMTWLYRSGFLFLLTAIILHVAGWYAILSLDRFSVSAALLFIVGLGGYAFVRRRSWQTWLLGVGLLLQAVMALGYWDVRIVWVLLPVLALYAAADWLGDRALALPLQGSALTAAYIFGVFMVLIPDELPLLRFTASGDGQTAAWAMLIAVCALLALSAAAKLRGGRAPELWDALLLAPWYFVPGIPDLLYVLALCGFSLVVLWRGYAAQWRFQVNLGTGLFLFAVLLAYTRLAWAFMSKSLFFVTGGLLLLALSWYLGRRRSRYLEGGHADDTKQG
ncbi:DUF2157 domain-containing protein [Paenibacillus sp. IB182496]|uniref:DUF2157 domain-containing protein n=1 Tax=Paenibacillus sabuli TaxID=2772509 RepID=A0A927BR74_9BACL|nr:DUF2157 domain-containing protein [Paenibacillus sabuli]MBD2844210.1 DUF2157 domain-containing protein [Paenibacillus sabuli]